MPAFCRDCLAPLASDVADGCCPGCGSYDLGYTVSKGRGTVYSFAEVHHPQFPIFEYPLLVVLVQLDEGTRILSNLVGVSGDQGSQCGRCKTRTT